MRYELRVHSFVVIWIRTLYTKRFLIIFYLCDSATQEYMIEMRNFLLCYVTSYQDVYIVILYSLYTVSIRL